MIDSEANEQEEMLELGLQNRYMAVRFILSVLLFAACPLVWLASWDNGWWITRQSKPRTFRLWFRRWCKLMAVATLVSVGLIVGWVTISMMRQYLRTGGL